LNAAWIRSANSLFSAAEDEGIEEQMKLIDEIVLEQRVYELLAPIGEDVFAGRRLQLRTRRRRCRG